MVALQQKRAQQQHKTDQRRHANAKAKLAEAGAQPPLQKKRAKQQHKTGQRRHASADAKLAEAGAQPPSEKVPAEKQTISVQSCHASGSFSLQFSERNNFVDVPRPCVEVESVFACR